MKRSAGTLPRALLLLLLAKSAHAVDPRTHISQHGHAVRRVRDGVLSSAPRAITQSKDGYIWIGTGLSQDRPLRWRPNLERGLFPRDVTPAILAFIQ